MTDINRKDSTEMFTPPATTTMMWMVHFSFGQHTSGEFTINLFFIDRYPIPTEQAFYGSSAAAVAKGITSAAAADPYPPCPVRRSE